jgi:hypothetical protein
MLQLLTEYHVMRGFDKKGALAKPEEEDPMVSNMKAVFECDRATAAQLSNVVHELCNRAPELLAMCSVKTIDDRLVRTAVAPLRPWVQDWTPPPDLVDAKTVKVVERILRGCAADKRVTVTASSFLAACFRRIVLESRNEPVPCAAAPPPVALVAGEPPAPAAQVPTAKSKATKATPRAKAPPAKAPGGDKAPKKVVKAVLKKPTVTGPAASDDAPRASSEKAMDCGDYQVSAGSC